MILEEFDKSKNAVLNPEHFHKPIKNIPKTCIGFFSKSVMNLSLENFNTKVVIDTIENATNTFSVYKINYNGVDLAVTHLPVGASACVANAEELISLGVKNILPLVVAVVC